MPIDWTTILNTLLSAVGGGGAVAYFNHKQKKAIQNSADYQDIIKILQEMNEKLNERVDELEERLKEEEQKRMTLETKLIMFLSAHQDLPIPQWIKGLDGTMLSINPAYEQIFLIPNGFSTDDYEMHHDSEIWGEETAKHFAIADKEVQRTGREVWAFEKVVVNEEEEEWHVLKYPRYSGDTIIGIGGIAFQKSNK